MFESVSVDGLEALGSGAGLTAVYWTLLEPMSVGD